MRKRILFLCTGNSARSQMAEALMRKLGGSSFEPFSAGLEPRGIHPLARQVIEELGIDMDTQYSKSLDEYMGKASFDYLVTVCSHADINCPFFPGSGARLHWDFEDPAAFEGTPEEKIGRFREVRDRIKARIVSFLADLK